MRSCISCKFLFCESRLQYLGLIIFMLKAAILISRQLHDVLKNLSTSKASKTFALQKILANIWKFSKEVVLQVNFETEASWLPWIFLFLRLLPIVATFTNIVVLFGVNPRHYIATIDLILSFGMSSFFLLCRIYKLKLFIKFKKVIESMNRLNFG